MTPEHPLLPTTQALPSLATTTVGQYDPAGHATGAYALSPTNEQLAPSGHATGADKPAAGHTLPDGHNGHAKVVLLWPVVLPNVPRGHGVGLMAPSGQNDPAGHAKANDRPGDGQYWPGGHTPGRTMPELGQANPDGHSNILTEAGTHKNNKYH
jgi:hypothetical protein